VILLPSKSREATYTLGQALAQAAWVAMHEASALEEEYSRKNRGRLPARGTEERREIDRLRALSQRMAYRANEEGWTDQSISAVFTDDYGGDE
jgi:hypothetical protein